MPNHSTRRLACTLLITGAAIAAFGAASAASAASAAEALPVDFSFPTAEALSWFHPGQSPPGANNYSCKPTARHPYPVVLVHGILSDETSAWNALSPLLANDGYCVFAINYGGSDPKSNPFLATGDMVASAHQLAAFVHQVLSATGARKVDIVGWSEGGPVSRYFAKFVGGAAVIDQLIGFSPVNHGTTLDGLLTFASHHRLNPLIYALSPALGEMEVGSPFMTKLDAGGDTIRGIRYTVIQTKYDEAVTPYTSSFLRGPDVRNILLQNQCSQDFSEHLAIIYDHVALQDVLNALDPAEARPPKCSLVLPFIGG